MKGEDRAEDEKAQHHLVGNFRMNDLARLAERVLVDVLDTPREVGRRAVMLPVDDVADAADRESDHCARATRVDDLPERELRSPRPDVGANHRAEEPAPLADAAFGQRQRPQGVAREEPEVLPHI